MMLFSRSFPVFALLAMLSAWNPPVLAAPEKPQVVTSLAPLELLVRAVAGDQVAVSTLVPAGASPHTYQLRPSERRRLAAADLVFWVGPDMESFLDRLLTGPDFTARTVALMPGEASGETHGHDHHDEHADHHPDEPRGGSHGHDHGDGEDPHVWLDPAIALTMADEIARHLKALDGVDASKIDENQARFARQLKEREGEIRQQLRAARELDLFTYHDAFSRFAEHYGLAIAGVLTLSPERTPGARHLARVQERLTSASRPCLLTEPQFNRQWWDSLMDDVTVPISTWDPLAEDIEPSADGYLEFQQSLADAVLRCLPEHAQ